jgi:predicted benzoate:H+ symporter BenE
MNTNIGRLESVVRVLIGLPMAIAYFYMRHFDPRLATLFLISGLALLAAAMEYELTAPVRMGRRSK